MDLQAEWKKRVAKINEKYTPEQITEAVKARAAKRREEEIKNRPAITYAIHKRSLPVGLNKKVMWGLSEEEANKWIKDYNKTSLINAEDSDMKTIIYFDKVKEDGKNHSVYENDYTKDTLFKQPDIEVSRGVDYDEIKWEG